MTPADNDKQSRTRLIDRAPIGGIQSADAILERFLGWVESTGIEPYPAQEEALLELMTGRHVILSTPTGSGKSLVATGLHFKALCEGRRSFYTAPIKALVSEKFFALCDQFGGENVGMLTGDASINWSAPIICCTAEVLANMAVRQRDQTDAPYVIMDEFHYYADRTRGVAWQVPLLTLPQTRFLLMSATLGDMRAITEHIEARTGREVAHVHSEERPVPLDYSYREAPLLETVEALLQERRQPIYIVHFTQREASEQAQGLTSTNVSTRDEKREIADALRDFRFDSPYGKDVQRFIRHGIGVHHAGLLPKYRLLVEQLAQRGLLKVICGTDTLGVGVNIPIRTVLFTKLSKYDGEKVALLTVRDFKQISGRAGRKGFDDLGSVVSQAPEHVVENRRLELKAAVGSRKKKIVRKKPPRGFVAWNEDTFQRLIYSQPETLVSRFAVTPGLMVGCLQSAAEDERGGGYRQLVELISLSHEGPISKARLRREAAVLFRALRGAGIIEVTHSEDATRPQIRVADELQDDFSMHHSLSLYLVDAVSILDKNSDTHTLDVLSLVESILENPRAILYQLVRKAKDELMAELKAERVPYEERLEKLDAVSWEKPNAEFIYATFNLFAEKHPWLSNENIRPKSIARAMFETYSTFDDFVRRFGLAAMEGVLLRYLGQVHNALAHSVPDALKTEGIYDLTSYLRTLLLHVDSSLLEEWERLIAPPPVAEVDQRPPTGGPRQGVASDPRAFQAQVRSDCHLLVRALARGDYEDAVRWVYPDPDDAWTAERFEHALESFIEEYDEIVFDPRARQAHLTVLKPDGPNRFRFHHVLVDPMEENLWNLEGEIDLQEEPQADLPLLRLRRIGT